MWAEAKRQYREKGDRRSGHRRVPGSCPQFTNMGLFSALAEDVGGTPVAATEAVQCNVSPSRWRRPTTNQHYLFATFRARKRTQLPLQFRTINHFK